MAKTIEEITEVEPENEQVEMDSKYRLIIVAAKRSKQLQRGARPRVDMDTQKHKPTRVALEEVMRG
jgi:DNA-directed RNA polymerase subunit omega